MIRLLAVLAALAALWSGAAQAGAAELHCGAVARSGIAEARPDGGAMGVAVDVCRAAAVAALGPDARVVFSLYDAPHDYDALRRGRDAIGFLTAAEIAQQGLAGLVVPGPTIAVMPIAVMVPEASPAAHVADLSNQVVCLMTASLGQRALEAVVLAQTLSIGRLAFQEDVEMLDAYNAGRCGAVVGEATALARMRQMPGVRGVRSRLLPEVLAVEPIVAVTAAADGRWASKVAWVFDALLLGDAAPVDRLPGLRPAWRQEARAAVGDYAAIMRRNWTERLGLVPGLNAPWPEGMLLAPRVQ